MKASTTEQYFPVVLFIELYKMVLKFNEITTGGTIQISEIYRKVLSSGTV